MYQFEGQQILASTPLINMVNGLHSLSIHAD
jgi:hypothetical protein